MPVLEAKVVTNSFIEFKRLLARDPWLVAELKRLADEAGKV